jgi:hypothetical protein
MKLSTTVERSFTEQEQPPREERKRIGAFTVSAHVIKDWKHQAVQSLFGAVVVLRCEHHFHSDTFEYVAYSELFEPVPSCMVAPRYELEVHREPVAEGSAVYSFTAKRV